MNSKPPIGITPRWLLDEEREMEIRRAITRYTDAGYPVPIEWYEELNEIVERLSEFYHVEYHKLIYGKEDYGL